MPSPDIAQIRKAVELHAAGKTVEAEQIYRSILAINPNEPNCLHMLGMLLFHQGDLAAAEPMLRRSVELVPQMPDWHHNLALLYRRTGRFDQALSHLRKAIELLPTSAEAHDNLGLMLDELNQPEAAAQEYEIATKLKPDYAHAHDHLAQSLWQRGRIGDAIASWRRVVQLLPDHADAHANLACGLISLGSHDEAFAHLQQALRAQPRHVAALTNMGWMLFMMDRLDESTSVYQQAVQIDPKNTGARMNLGICLLETGDYRQAIDCYRKGLSVQPDHLGLRSNLLLALQYEPEIDRSDVFEEHLQYARILKVNYPAPQFSHNNDRNPERPLRIGFVSPDFRRHPVASFVEPILRAHHRDAFTISCYSDVQKPDQVTQRLRGHVENWYETAGLNSDQLAELINANREDILIDLAGHTGKARLPTFARKPAPIQITYLGYLNTTGMEAMDYRLTDALVDPPGESDRFYTEKLLRLPCFFCYEPPVEAPEVAPLPAVATGRITFGSLNHPGKFNDGVLDLWAKLLEAVPDSQLALAIVSPGESERRLRSLLAQHGVNSDRLRIIARQPYEDYLKLFDSIDIGLDPFPFNGHTTTCDTLLMGVPVITLPGQTYASRMSAAVLTHLGMPELITRDADHYVQIAAELAGDRARLADLRNSLRSKMRDSTITNAPEFAANLERAFREIWQQWCKQ